MSRYLFVSLPLSGHLDWGGMLATAAALAGLGHAVAWASEVTVRSPVERAGVEFRALRTSGWHPQPPLPPDIPRARWHQMRARRALDAWLHLETVQQATIELGALINAWRPDVLVAEPYASAAALAAEITSLPLVVCGRPALLEDEGSGPGPVAGRIERHLRLAGVPGANWDLARGQIRSPLLHLDYFSRSWYADLPQVAPQTRFAGGVAPPGEVAATEETPIVLVTLGSLFREDPDFFRIAAEAVLSEGGRPLVVSGQRGEPQDPALLAALPPGVDLRNWVDFDATLPHVAGIVHHGGVGTTHAALRHGLPQVAVPRAGDQRPQAGRITQAGVGYGVRPADFTPAAARWMARRLLTDPTLRARARAWQSDLAALGGVKAAALTLAAL